MSEPMPRFTGIFIPVEILEMKELTLFEMILLSWIDALYCPDHGGCYASNDYLGSKIGNAKENTVAKSLTKLRNLKLIEDVSFNGRIRVIRALINRYTDKAQSKSGLDKNPRGVGKKSKSELDFSPSSPYIDSKVDRKGERKEKTPHPPKPKKITKKLILYGRHVSLKEGEYEELCKELTKPLVDHYIEQMNNYVPNRKQGAYRDYAAAIRQWHRRDQTEGKLPKANNFQSQEDELERITSNRHWFRNFITQIKPPNQFEVTGSYSDYVQFSNHERNNSSAKFYFKDADFQEKIKQESAKRLYVKRN